MQDEVQHFPSILWIFVVFVVVVVVVVVCVPLRRMPLADPSNQTETSRMRRL